MIPYSNSSSVTWITLTTKSTSSSTVTASSDLDYWPVVVHDATNTTSALLIDNGISVYGYPQNLTLPSIWETFTQVKPDPNTLKQTYFKRKIKEQLAPTCFSRASRNNFNNCSPQELRALSVLKKTLKSDEWVHYLKYGFIEVKGTSHLTYVIHRKNQHVMVYRRKGEKAAEICIYFKNIPPTDRVLALKIMIECDERDIWRKGNIHFPKGSLINSIKKDQKNLSNENLLKAYLE